MARVVFKSLLVNLLVGPGIGQDLFLAVQPEVAKPEKLNCTTLGKYGDTVFADMHDGDQKKVSLVGNKLTIRPHANNQTWVVETTVDDMCKAIVDFNVPGKPGPPPVKLTAHIYVMISKGEQSVKHVVEFTDPSGTLAPHSFPLNEWVALPRRRPTAVTGGGALPFTEAEYAVRIARWKDLMKAPTSVSTCSNDMRDKMPACSQFGNMWCWATGVAALVEYYQGSGPAKCTGQECQIVGWTWNSSTTACCPYTSHIRDCGGLGGYISQQVTAATHFTGRTHKSAGGPLSQAVLDKSLQGGAPILMQVGHGNRASHVVQVRGCGDGMYYFWDPEWGTTQNGRVEPIYPAGSDKRTYKQLLSYDYDGYVVNWIDTVYAE